MVFHVFHGGPNLFKFLINVSVGDKGRTIRSRYGVYVRKLKLISAFPSFSVFVPTIQSFSQALHSLFVDVFAEKKMNRISRRVQNLYSYQHDSFPKEMDFVKLFPILPPLPQKFKWSVTEKV